MLCFGRAARCASWLVVLVGSGCGSDPRSLGIELLTPRPGQILTLADDTDEARDGLQFRATGSSIGVVPGTTVHLFVDDEQRAQGAQIDEAGEIDFGEVTLPPGEHAIRIETTSRSTSSDEDQRYTFRALLIREPADDILLTAVEDEDQREPFVQVGVRVEAFALGPADVTLLRDDQAVATLAPDPLGFVGFAGVTLMDGRHTLLAQAASDDESIRSPPITVEVNEGACAQVTFLTPAPPGPSGSVSLGGPNDCPSGSDPFVTDVRLSADVADGRRAQLLVNGQPAGDATVEDSIILFDDVQLPIGGGALTLAVEVESSDRRSCETAFPADVFVDCSGPRCELRSPAPFVATDASGVTTLYLNATMLDASNAFDVVVASEVALEGSEVQLVVDGRVGSPLTAEAEASANSDDVLAAFDGIALADGEHTIEAFCTDASGNVGSSGELTWVVDTTPCAVSVSDPVAGTLFVPDDDEDGASAGTQVVVTSAVAGDDCVAQRTRLCDPAVGIATGDFIAYGGSSPLLSSLRLDDGTFEQSLCVEVQDRAGNTALDSVAVSYVRNAPAVLIESPLDGDRYNAAGGGVVRADADRSTATCDASFSIACTLGVPVQLRAAGPTGALLASGPCVAPDDPDADLTPGFEGRASLTAPFDDGDGTGTVVALQTIVASSTKTLVGMSRAIELRGDCNPPVPLLIGDPCQLADDGFLEVVQDTDTVTRDVSVRLVDAGLGMLALSVANSDGTSATIASPDGSGVGDHLFAGVPFGGVGVVTIAASVVDAAGNPGRTECSAQITTEPPGLILTQPVSNQAFGPRAASSETCDTGDPGEYGVRVVGTLDQAQNRTASIYVNGILVAGNVALAGTMLDACVPVPDDALRVPPGPSTLTTRIATTRLGNAFVERSRTVSVRTLEITDPGDDEDLFADGDCATGPGYGYTFVADVDVSYLGAAFTLSSELGPPIQGTVTGPTLSECVPLSTGSEIVTLDVAGTAASDSVAVNVH